MMNEMKKMKTLTLQGIPFEVVDEAARNDIESVKDTLENLPKNEIVTPDLAQNDPTAPDYVKNRTHYEETSVVNEPLNITWDGNTEGLVNPNNSILYKVSDLVLTEEQLKTATITRKVNVDDTWEESEVLEEAFEYFFQEGLITEDCTFLGDVVCVRKSGTYDGYYFAETGIYFTTQVTNQTQGVIAYVSSLTTADPVEQIKTVVHKLDKKYLPDDIGGGVTLYHAGYDEYIYTDDARTNKATKEDIDSMLSKGVIRVVGDMFTTQLVSVIDEGDYYHIGFAYVQYDEVYTRRANTAEYVAQDE